MKKILTFILCFMFNCAMAQDFIIENKNAPQSPSYLLDKRNTMIKAKKVSEKELHIESFSDKTNESFTYEKQADSKKGLSSNLLNTNKVDWHSYMRKVNLDIKANWTKSLELIPDRVCDNKTVVFFKINKEGSAFDYKIVTSSGNGIQDEAAINSIKQASPFEKLPLNFDKEDVDIEFNFECHSLYPPERPTRSISKKNEHFHP